MNGRRDITFVLPGRGLFGGIRVVVEHANRLITRGHRVTIVCHRAARSGRPRALARRLYRDVRLAVGFDRDHLHDFRGTLLLAPREGLDQVAPDADVIVATHWLTAEGVARLPACKGEKFYFIQGYEIHGFPAADIDPTWRLPMRKLVVSSWLRDMAAERFGDRTAVLVSNGVDRSVFHSDPRRLDTPPTVGVVYSAASVKGVATALGAVKKARKSFPDLRLVSFGAERPGPALPLPKGSSFELRPAQSRLRALYGRAHVWLCASEREGFALPPLEAMACRCPAVVTRCGGPADYMIEGENGFSVDVGDVDAMASRIVEVVSDATRWRKLSDAAQATAGRFDIERAAERFEQALLGESIGVAVGVTAAARGEADEA